MKEGETACDFYFWCCDYINLNNEKVYPNTNFQIKLPSTNFHSQSDAWVWA